MSVPKYYSAERVGTRTQPKKKLQIFKGCRTVHGPTTQWGSRQDSSL